MPARKKTRHGSFADQMIAWRNRPEGEPEPLQTNWRVTPSNDNANPEEVVDMGFERHLRITPSVQEIKRNIETNDVERNKAGQIVRIGKLRFSDGGQSERAWCYGPDGKLIQYDAPMPVGAMLGTRDKADGQLGGSGYKKSQIDATNDYFAEILATDYPRYLKRTTRRNGPSFAHEKRVAMLAAAYANTPVLPPVTYCPPALPCGSPRPAESFLGMRKGKKGQSGGVAWEDIATSIVNREIWDETLAYLSRKDKDTLDTAMTAKNMQEIGILHGFVGKRAERMGKKILAAANDNLRDAMRISAA